MRPLLIALLIAASASLQALGQDVDIRSIADKLGGGGGGGSEGSQSRTIYQHTRQQPQHRIMHFGKRPLLEQPASNFGLYQQQQLANNEMPLSSAGRIINNNNKYPVLLSIELGQGQTLQELPEDGTAYELTQPAKSLVYNVEQRSPQANGAKLMRLISAEQVESGPNGSKSDSELAELAEAKQDSQASSFSVSTRSMMQRPGGINKAYISSLLFGRGSLSPSLPGLGYIKKAEPRENLFMHFGRK